MNFIASEEAVALTAIGLPVEFTVVVIQIDICSVAESVGEASEIEKGIRESEGAWIVEEIVVRGLKEADRECSRAQDSGDVIGAAASKERRQGCGSCNAVNGERAITIIGAGENTGA